MYTVDQGCSESLHWASLVCFWCFSVGAHFSLRLGKGSTRFFPAPKMAAHWKETTKTCRNYSSPGSSAQRRKADGSVWRLSLYGLRFGAVACGVGQELYVFGGVRSRDSENPEASQMTTCKSEFYHDELKRWDYSMGLHWDVFYFPDQSLNTNYFPLIVPSHRILLHYRTFSLGISNIQRRSASAWEL